MDGMCTFERKPFAIRVGFLALVLLFCLGFSAVAEERVTIEKHTGRRITPPANAAGDILEVRGDPLEPDDWEQFEGDLYPRPFHLRLLNGQKTIPEEALLRCEQLLSVEGPDVEWVASNAFANCSVLRSFDFPALVSLDCDAFVSCESLTAAELPATLRWLDNPFLGCSGLETIRVAAGNMHFTSVGGVLYNIGETRLISYPAARKAASFADGRAETLDRAAFFATERTLTHVSLSALKSVGEAAFYAAGGIVSIDLPHAEEIGPSAFSGCRALTALDLPRAARIGHGAFGAAGGKHYPCWRRRTRRPSTPARGWSRRTCEVRSASARVRSQTVRNCGNCGWAPRPRSARTRFRDMLATRPVR